MSALNPNNPNGGGKGDFQFLTHTPPKVDVETPAALSEHAYPGNGFKLDTPSDGVANPHGENHGWGDVRIAG
jgi:hypothetical protein